jgi:small-conductance mechanosensitive channel
MLTETPHMEFKIKTRQMLITCGLLMLIIAAGVGLFLTRDSGSAVVSTARRKPLVDEGPVQTARRMAALAFTRDEYRLAQQALRLADHAVDLAFADAIRTATLHTGGTTPAAKQMFARVSRGEAQVKSDQELLDQLKKEAAKSQHAAPELQQQINLVQAQLELDQDELEDAKGDLLRSGADPLSRIQRQFARYQAAQQESDAARGQLRWPDADTIPVGDHFLAQYQSWRAERAKRMQLQQARDEALNRRAELEQKHDSTEQAGNSQAGSEEGQAPHAATDNSPDQAVISSLREMSEHRKNLADLDKRIQDHQSLADVYGSWIGLVQAHERANAHAMIRSALLILLIILAFYLIQAAVDRLFPRFITDRRRLRTLSVVMRFVLQAICVLLIVFILFGMPSQMPTIIGLAGAGLTVALKDFIMAFLGWFTLMGRNGIRTGDWVEINGVVGEVAEISLLRTVLLETGNWNDSGHPTGRKVAFVNSFAIEGHYFNFSTTGQWLWDELQVLVPASENPYPIIDAIHKVVANATEANARKAEQEWQHGTHREGLRGVSAEPAINLRPTGSGVEVHVRYITRANERSSTRARLYEDIVDLLHGKQPQPVDIKTAEVQ